MFSFLRVIFFPFALCSFISLHSKLCHTLSDWMKVTLSYYLLLVLNLRSKDLFSLLLSPSRIGFSAFHQFYLLYHSQCFLFPMDCCIKYSLVSPMKLSRKFSKVLNSQETRWSTRGWNQSSFNTTIIPWNFRSKDKWVTIFVGVCD